MKKIFIVFLFAFLAFGFNFDHAQASEKGDLVIQPSLNIGNYGIGRGYGNGFGIGVTANVEYAVHDYASVGGFVGFNNVSIKGWNGSYNRIGFGARGVFHFWQLIDDKVSKDLKSDAIDFYLPMHIGYGIYTGSGTSGGDVIWGTGLGIRYYFKDNMGVSFEFGGMELSYAKIGMAFKL